MGNEKSFNYLASTLLVAVALIGPSNGLQCYSCSTDSSDLDCDDLSVLPKVDCTPFSASHPVQPVCGYQRLAASTGEESERIWRGCAIGGQCALLSRLGDEAYNSVFSLSVCEECSTDNCNGQSSGGVIIGTGSAPWMIVMLIVATLITLH
ncbi:AGAP013137-PA-like protein [Anopheles sinensis]|uniref:AGAP013137-PA-like protein n=1 Tax=Anopheles sinensis TaxID=74873 RepID=A0A084W1Q1_ANOSI|nr:AGAP013137-PA-like protein [Anopheles sinensis]